MYERTAKSGVYTRPMVTKDSDLDRAHRLGPEVRPHRRHRQPWSNSSPPTCASDLAKIKSPLW